MPLTTEQQAMVDAARRFVAGEDRTVEVLSTFVDDHIIGCIVAFGPNKVRLAFPCCGWEMCAAFEYAGESNKAWGMAKDLLNADMKDSDDEDFCDMHDVAPWMEAD